MTKNLLFITLATLSLVARASAGTFFGALSNFDAVNDTGSPCNGFEIELDDVHSSDITYTFEFQRYGVPKISEDTFLVNGVSHPRTFVRWLSPYDQVKHAFVEATPVAPADFKNTGGHLCYRNMNVGGQPYETAGCEHFGVGTLINPSASVYRWMKEDPTTPGSLIAEGSPVTIPAPVWTVNPMGGAPPVVVAVIPVPPPPAVVPVPYLPDAEFGVAVWAKVFETESSEHADLEHLVADDVAVPGNLGPVPNPNAVTEIEWQILQTDSMNPSVNELQSSKQIGSGNESVTRRYEFYKYVGPYDINSSDGPNTGTNEALCASVGADGMHGGAGTATVYDANGTPTDIECSSIRVVGEYIGAQNAAANIATPLSANGTNLVHGEVGVRYPDRPLIFGGSGGPYSIAFASGTLPASDAGNEFSLDPLTGVLKGGIPNGTGLSTFIVHATDLVEPTQAAVDATFNLTVVAAVAVDDVVIPDGAKGETTSVDVTASGGETPFRWSAAAVTAGLAASVFGNTLSVTASDAGDFEVQVTVEDSLGGTNARTLTYHVSGVALPTSTPTETGATPTPTESGATPTPTESGATPTPTESGATPTPTTVASVVPTATSSEVPSTTPTLAPTPAASATATGRATATMTATRVVGTPSVTATPTSGAMPTPPQSDSCHIGAEPSSGVSWMLLLPVALLAWRPSKRR